MFKSFLQVSFLVFLLFSIQVFGEADPNPDSPTPILLQNRTDSTRILAVSSRNWRNNWQRSGENVFTIGADNSITIFVSNVELMPKEDANAFRVYLLQKNGKTFELPTENLSQVSKTTYGLKIRLYDSDGFRGQPENDGDSVIYLTWRGLASNALKISFGKLGGNIKIPDFAKSNSPANESPTTDVVGYRWSGDRIRFLEQATFGPTTELDSRIRRIGLRTWLAEQFETSYPTIPYPNIPQMPINIPDSCTLINNAPCYRERYTMQPLQQWFFKEAFYGDAQLKHRVSWALSQIWVTSGVSIQQSSHLIAYHKIISDNAFGNYRNLMYAATLSPTMGDYLDMIRSTNNNPNENFGREILQLFSIGLYQLNQDGTIQRDAQNNPIPTYSQETINNFSKVFTGWSYCNVQGCPNAVPGSLNFQDPMLLVPSNHDLTAKTLLDYPNAVSPNIPECLDCTTSQATINYANASLKQALDNIFYHPNTPPFVSKLLIQHLVTSDPSPAYVERVANVFTNNGQNIRGDMKSVIRAILLDPEARGNIKTAPRYGKLREPVQVVTNLGRIFPAQAFNGQSITDGGISSSIAKMGQIPFYSPTVFNYFAPDFVVPGTSINAPEFAILNTSSVVARTNFAYLLVFEGIVPNATDSLRGLSLNLNEAITNASADSSGNQLLDYLNYKMLHGAMSAEHRNSVLTAIIAISSDNPALRAKTAIYLIGVSSQYQIQR